jgi:putative hemolysin
MNNISTEILIVICLILLNGGFVMAEMAIVSARKVRLEQKADTGSPGARKALALADNPNRFLSTSQIGITLIGILSGAFGGATIADTIEVWLKTVPWLVAYSKSLSVTLVVIVLTYFTLVLGELVPKRIALNHAERIAVELAPVMQAISTVATPLVGLLSASTNAVLKILGIRPNLEPEVTEADIKSMLDQGTEVGVFEEAEQDMVERIFRLSDRSVSALMTPRTDVVFMDAEADHDEIRHVITTHPISRFPVIQGTPDNVIGWIQARDLLLQPLEGQHFDIHKVLHPPFFIPESATALEVLEQLKKETIEIAFVIDEYGGLLGLVSMDDILEAIVGDVVEPYGDEEPEAIQREDGSWLLDGMILVDELEDLLDLDELPREDEGQYETLNGFVMAQLGRVPSSGDYFEFGGFRFEVMDMDGRRVDKVLVSAVRAANPGDA